MRQTEILNGLSFSQRVGFFWDMPTNLPNSAPDRALIVERSPTRSSSMATGRRSYVHNRIYYGARTAVPLSSVRRPFAPMRIGYSSDLDGDMLTARDHVAVKTAMPMET